MAGLAPDANGNGVVHTSPPGRSPIYVTGLCHGALGRFDGPSRIAEFDFRAGRMAVSGRRAGVIKTCRSPARPADGEMLPHAVRLSIEKVVRGDLPCMLHGWRS